MWFGMELVGITSCSDNVAVTALDSTVCGITLCTDIMLSSIYKDSFGLSSTVWSMYPGISYLSD